MKTTKINRIEIGPKDQNIEIALLGGTIMIEVKPDGQPLIVVWQDDAHLCGNPYLKLSADTYDLIGEQQWQVGNEKQIRDQYTHSVQIELLGEV